MGILDYLSKKTSRFKIKKKIDEIAVNDNVDDLRYIFNHQVLVVQNNLTVELSKPLFNIYMSLKINIDKKILFFPLIVGEDGRLISAQYGRRIWNIKDHSQTSVYLEYYLNREKTKKIILRIIGQKPQMIQITQDDRKNPSVPLVLFLHKRN